MCISKAMNFIYVMNLRKAKEKIHLHSQPLTFFHKLVKIGLKNFGFISVFSYKTFCFHQVLNPVTKTFIKNIKRFNYLFKLLERVFQIVLKLFLYNDLIIEIFKFINITKVNNIRSLENLKHLKLKQ